MQKTADDKDLLANILSSFSCERDRDIEKFLHERAVLFERLDKSRTYFIIDEEQYTNPSFKLKDLKIYGYFTLSLKIFVAPDEMSNRQRLALDGFSAKEHGKPIKNFPCYLLGQLARNSNVPKDSISGAYLLQTACEMTAEAVDVVGGRSLLVECQSSKNLVQFYLDNGFFEVAHIPDEDRPMTQLMRKIGASVTD